jgi:hypothetical protein
MRCQPRRGIIASHPQRARSLQRLGAVSAQSPNAVICSRIAGLKPALDAVLTQAQADPSSVGTSSGAIATLKRDARLFNQWSNHASTTVTGTTIRLPAAAPAHGRYGRAPPGGRVSG